MTPSGCVNSSESFCSICGEFVVKKQHRNITDFVCGDLKVISIILGQQGGYSKFFCEWDSRAKVKHWNQKVWPKRTVKGGEKNVHFESLVEPEKGPSTTVPYQTWHDEAACEGIAKRWGDI